jgi:hypothetical protein
MIKRREALFAVACLAAAGCSNQEQADNVALGGNLLSAARSEAPPKRIAASAADGPFGIGAGTALERLEKDADRNNETGVTVLTSAPKPSSQFPTVAVVSYPETGICEIRALSQLFESDPYITSATGFADEVASALESRYGPGKRDSGCNGYSCESDYKLQHVEDGSLWYGYQWKSKEERKLPSRISSIDLYVIHAQFNDSQVRLDYKFDNEAACSRASKSAKAGNL